MTQLMETLAPATVLGTPLKELALRVHSRRNAGPAQVVLLAGQKVSIGADPQCSFRLTGERLEPCYCLVLRGESADVVRSFSPRTKLNGADFQDAPLHAGDRLQLDEVELEVLPSSEAMERDLEAEQRVLDALSEDLRGQREGIEARAAEIEQRERAFEAERAALQDDRNALQSEQEQLRALRAGAAAEQVKLAADRAEAQELARRLDEERHHLEQVRGSHELERRSCESARTALAVREQTIEGERAALQAERSALHAEREQLQNSLTSAIDDAQAEVAAERAQCQEQTRRFDEERRVLDELRATLDDERRSLEATRAELAERESQFQSRLDESARAESVPDATEAVSEATCAAELALAQDREQLVQEREAWEEERNRWENECERWERESSAFQEDLERREQVLQESRAVIESRPTVLDDLIAEESFSEADGIEPAPDRIAAELPVAEVGEEDDSIDNYMQLLLQRANVNPKEASPNRRMPAFEDSRQVVVEPLVAKPAVPVERRVRRPDRPKPEQAVDLSTLREIANINAKGALDRHSERQSAQKRLNRILVGGGGCAFVMIVLACLGVWPTITAALAVASTAVAFLGWRQYQIGLRRFNAVRGDQPAESTPVANQSPTVREPIAPTPDAPEAENAEPR